MPMSVHVHLLSGRSVTLETEPEASIDSLSQKAQSALGVGKGRLLTASGDALAEGTVQGAGLQDKDVLTLQVGEVRVKASRNLREILEVKSAWAALLGDGSVMTWGHAEWGGDSSTVQGELKNVLQVQASVRAFAAIRADGSVGLCLVVTAVPYKVS